MKHVTFLALIAFSLCSFSAQSEDQIAVSSPAHEVDLAFPESGILSTIEVEEGAVVRVGQVLARLDSNVQEAQLKIAEIRAKSDAKFRAAKARLDMNQKRLEKLNALGESGRANPDEIARSQTDYQSAYAEAQLAREEALTAAVQVEQFQAEIERRILRSPIDGIVNRVYRDVAESVTGVDTIVVTVVNLDSLDLTAHIDSSRAQQLKTGQTLQVQPLRGDQDAASATVVYVSPVTESSSGTVRVRLELQNSGREHNSGEKYRLQLDSAAGLAQRVVEEE